MEKKIADNGWVLSDSANISIVLKIEEGESDKMQYTASRFLFAPPVSSLLRRGGTAIDFKPERYQILVLQDDETLWHDTHLTTPPQHIKLDEVKEESLQKVVDKAMAEQSYKKWLDGVTIPQMISRSLDNQAVSRVTEEGIEDIRSLKVTL